MAYFLKKNNRKFVKQLERLNCLAQFASCHSFQSKGIYLLNGLCIKRADAGWVIHNKTLIIILDATFRGFGVAF